jgi:AcrR family transcriptional regulator
MVVSTSSISPVYPTSNGGRREAIINVAALHFAQQGFHAVSMRDIAKANGSSVAALYNHFESKDDLLLAVGERFFAVFTPQLYAAADSPGDGLARLHSMLRVTFDAGVAYRPEFLTISRDNRHIAMTPKLVPLITKRDECVAVWDRVLQQGMEDGSIRERLETAAVIWIVFSAVTGMLDENRAAEFAGAVEDPLDCLSDLLTQGLKPRS